jgi:hypothetical protein
MPRKWIFLCTVGLVSGHAVTAVMLQFAIQLPMTTELHTETCVHGMAFQIPPSCLQQELEIHHPCATFFMSTTQIGLNRWTYIHTNKQREKEKKKEGKKERNVPV